SIIATHATLLPSDFTFLTDTSCVIADTGVFISHYLNRFGCDSTVTLKVLLDNYNACHLEYSFTIDTPACYGDDVYFHIDIIAGEGPILMRLFELDQVWEFYFDTLGHYDLPWVGISEAGILFSSP